MLLVKEFPNAIVVGYIWPLLCLESMLTYCTVCGRRADKQRRRETEVLYTANQVCHSFHEPLAPTPAQTLKVNGPLMA